MTWHEGMDPRTIPDHVLQSERGRRNQALRKNKRGGSGRPKVIRTCEGCGLAMGAREFRKHKCTGEAK